jgi:hypothetical protein
LVAAVVAQGETAAPDQGSRASVAHGWGGTGVQNHDNTIGGIQPDVHPRGNPGNRTQPIKNIPMKTNTESRRHFCMRLSLIVRSLVVRS